MYMSTEKLAAVLTAALLAVPAGLTAQGQRAHHPDAQAPSAGPGAMMGGAMPHGVAGSGPGTLLARREALGLTDGQVEKLQELRSRADELRASHRSRMLSVREELGAMRSSDDPDLERYESLLREQADLRVEMRVQMAKIRRDGLEVLTDEQRAQLPSETWVMGSMGMQPGAGMSGGAPGMGSGMMNMGGGASGAHMMQMMAAMHGQMHGQMQMQSQDCPMIPDPSDED